MSSRTRRRFESSSMSFMLLITVHTLQFLKLYLLTCYENGSPLPEITEHLVISIMNVICEESNGGVMTTRRCKETTLLLKQLLSCENCERLWNRNGSLNILRCGKATMRKEPRPAYMLRGNNFSDARSAGTAQGEGLPTLV